MPYIAVQAAAQTLALTDHGRRTGYIIPQVSFPAPIKREAVAQAMRWGGRVSGHWDDLAERSFLVQCDEDALLVLQQAVDTYRARLLWQSTPDAPVIWSTIRAADVIEDAFDLRRRMTGIMEVRVHLVTDSEWTGAGVAFTEPTVIVDRGDRPARMRLKLTSSSANAVLGIGVKPNPSAAYDPYDVVGSPSATTLTGTYAAVHTAEVKDTNAHRGQHVVVAKIATNAVEAANTRYRAVASVSGSGVSATAAATKDSRAAQSRNYMWTALPGLVDIPAGGVPGIETGSGYGAEVLNESYGTASYSLASSHHGEFTFTPDSSFRLTRIKFYGRKFLWSTAVHTVRIRRSGGDTLAIGVLTLATTDGDAYAEFDSSVDLSGGVEYVLSVHTTTEDNFVLFYSSGTFAQLYFVTYGKTPLGFDSTVTVQAKCSESSKTATLSSVTLLPADDFAAVYEHAFGANEGVLIEATDPLSPPAAYLTTSTDGTAGPTVAPSAYAGTPRLRPGVNQIVTAADGTVSLSGVWMPCYSNAAAGSL